MLTYSFLDIGMLAILALAIVFAARKFHISFRRYWILPLIILIILTLIFDNVILAFHIVDYSQAHILGIFIGKAPIEDFAYPIAAVFITRLIWQLMERKK